MAYRPRMGLLCLIRSPRNKRMTHGRKALHELLAKRGCQFTSCPSESGVSLNVGGSHQYLISGLPCVDCSSSIHFASFSFRLQNRTMTRVGQEIASWDWTRLNQQAGTRGEEESGGERERGGFCLDTGLGLDTGFESVIRKRPFPFLLLFCPVLIDVMKDGNSDRSIDPLSLENTAPPPFHRSTPTSIPANNTTITSFNVLSPGNLNKELYVWADFFDFFFFFV